MIPLHPVPRPIDQLLLGAPDAIALADRTGMMTYAAAESVVGALAAALAARGLEKGARVAAWLSKTRIACLLPLAVARAGLVYVPINPVLKRAQVAHILADSGASLLITQAARADTLEPDDAHCPIIDEAEMPTTGAHLSPSAADSSALVELLYTSGSTGRPKGVMLSHANLWLGAISVAHYLRLTTNDRVLAVLPLSFDYGQNQLLSTWAAGGCVVPLDYLTPRDVVKAVAREAITTLAGVPPLWTQLLESEWPNETALRRLTNSGGKMTPALVRGLRALFPAADLYAMYGLTEAFRSTYLDPALIDAYPDAIGDAIPFAEVMVVGADGLPSAPGEPGELVHAGPLVAQGYWQDAERSAARFRPAPDWAEHDGTAVWSGDTVVRGADGLLRFVGRDDEMIKSSGNRLSPNEIEDAIMAGGETAEAVAIGIADVRLGQAIHVVARGDGSTEEALRARLRRDLPAFMQPAVYHWRSELPRNANGKLDRAALRAELTS